MGCVAITVLILITSFACAFALMLGYLASLMRLHSTVLSFGFGSLHPTGEFPEPISCSGRTASDNCKLV